MVVVVAGVRSGSSSAFINACVYTKSIPGVHSCEYRKLCTASSGNTLIPDNALLI